MNTSSPLIMIVDDEPANCKLLEQALSSNYETIICPDGEICLEKAPISKPDLILLDVMMPGKNGHEVCEQLRLDSETTNIPVIFISALDTLEDRIKGYDAGGDDYLGKPVHLPELYRKIEIVLKNQIENNEIKKIAEEAQAACMTALTLGSESARVSEFVNKTLTMGSIDDICKLFFDTMKAFGLKSVVQLRLNDEIITINSDWQSLPLEHELMVKAHTEGRIIALGKRLFFNYQNCSVLVKNTPIDKEEVYGRIKDNIIVLAEAMNSRVIYLNTELNLKKQLDVNHLYKDTAKAVELIQQQLEYSTSETISIAQKMVHDIEEKLVFLGLEEDQEHALLDILDVSTKQLVDLTEGNKEKINTAFTDVISTMEKANKLTSQ
ncbi:MAG: response regulator [Gammaproteobacteria bacterium]|nr:response regulator [Gammaproteobacteria bacterium]